MILGLHHAQVMIPIGQEDQARGFYCQLLGLSEITKPDALRGRGGLWLEVGESQVHIGATNEPVPGSSRAHLAYLVDDLEALQKRLEERGFKVTAGASIPGLLRFECRDPFGNRVEFLRHEGRQD